MTDMIYMAGGMLAVLLIAVLVMAVSLWCRGKHQAGIALISMIVLLLSVGGYGICMFRDSSQKAVEAQVISYESSTLEQAENSYQEALVLLRAASLQNADVRSLKAALQDLEAIDGNGHMSEVLEKKYPDVPVLLSYTKLLLAASRHEEGLNSRLVAQDSAMVTAAQEIPSQYAGQLSDKILPARNLILAMKTEGDKKSQQDARDLAQHKEKMEQGEYGIIAKGDPESQLVPALGQPAYVNEQAGKDEPKQYVFLHNSHNIYVYTKNGIVTDIRGL